MEINVKADPKEVAALVLAVQERQPVVKLEPGMTVTINNSILPLSS